MVRSMTGFGRGTSTENGREYLVEIKTVNHRYLDTSIRITRAYSFLENRVRETISKKIVRGKVDISIWIEEFGTSGRTMLLDEGLVNLYIDSLNKIKQKYGINEEISLSLVSRFPDVLKVRKEEDDEETIGRELEKALNEAVASLIQMREREGLQLKNDILEKTQNLLSMVSQIETRAPDVIVEYKTKFKGRIKEHLGDVSMDEGRLEMEVALFADRCSIEEEITRLKSHIKQVKQVLDGGEAVGRKLDFLVQEMNREINTIGSKANDLEITKLVVESKSEIEKIREQIQNIE